MADRRSCATLGILIFGSLLLSCALRTIPPSPSIQLAPDRQALLVTAPNQSTPSRLTFQNLPTESTIAPGLLFNPQRFDQVRLSPDGRYAAFSTIGHHTLVGLLDLASMAVQEIDVITEGDVMAFHWASDSRTLAYDYLPASGYRRVKAYDVQSGESLGVPQPSGGSAVHITFEKWGSQPREVILSVKDIRDNTRQTNTIKLVPRK